MTITQHGRQSTPKPSAPNFREMSSSRKSRLRRCCASANFGARRTVGVDGQLANQPPRSHGIWRKLKSSHVNIEVV